MGSGTKWLRPLVSHLKRALRVSPGETEGGWGLAQGSWVGGVSRPAGQRLHCCIRQSLYLVSYHHLMIRVPIVLLCCGTFSDFVFMCAQESESRGRERERERMQRREREGLQVRIQDAARNQRQSESARFNAQMCSLGGSDLR